MQPTNYKYKKNFKKKFKNFKFNTLIAGMYGIRVLDSCILTPKQLETIRRVFVRLTKRDGKFLIRIPINQSVTKKSKGSRMGKGTGSIDSWVMDVNAGSIIFEFSFFNKSIIKNFISEIKKKLSPRIEIVFREVDV